MWNGLEKRISRLEKRVAARTEKTRFAIVEGKLATTAQTASMRF